MCYFSRAVDRKTRAKAVKWLQDKLKDVDFDTIVVRGHSGVAMGSVIAHVMDKNLIIIRKPDEDAHSHEVAEYGDEVLRGRNRMKFIIIDDCVDSGETIKQIHEGFKKAFPRRRPIFKGLYLYQDFGMCADIMARGKIAFKGIDIAKNPIEYPVHVYGY